MGTLRIPLSSRKHPDLFALIDEEDAPLVAPFTWFPTWSRDGAIYARANQPRPRSQGTSLKMHRLILNARSDEIVDHINRDTLDNRRCNLRIVSRLSNNLNRQKQRASVGRFKGVFPSKGEGSWRCELKISGIVVFHATYSSDVAAASAYDYAVEEFGPPEAATNVALGLLSLDERVPREGLDKYRRWPGWKGPGYGQRRRDVAQRRAREKDANDE